MSEENNNNVSIDIKTEVAKIMENKSELISEQVTKAITESITRSMDWKVRDKVGAAVAEYIDEQIIPEVTAELIKNHDVIIEQFTSGMTDITQKICDKMVEGATKNLTGYRGADILKNLFAN